MFPHPRGRSIIGPANGVFSPSSTDVPYDESLHECLKEEKVGRWDGDFDHPVHGAPQLKARDFEFPDEITGVLNIRLPHDAEFGHRQIERRQNPHGDPTFL